MFLKCNVLMKAFKNGSCICSGTELGFSRALKIYLPSYPFIYWRVIQFSIPSKLTDLLKRKALQEEVFVRQFLKGTKDADLGVFCDLFSAKSCLTGQDGGVVTALLQKGLGEGLFDAAIMVRRMEGYTADVVVAENPHDISASSGTSYLKVNVTAKLRELIARGKKRLAIVCTPCEIHTVRKIQHSLPGDCKITIIGLFCFEAFNRDKLKQQVKERLGVDLDNVKKTKVHNGKFTADFDGGEVSCKVKDLDCAAEKVCTFCDDFVSRLADVSVGSVGSRQGYSTVIVRSDVGKTLVANHDFALEPADKAEVARLCELKRIRAKKSFSCLNSH